MHKALILPSSFLVLSCTLLDVSSAAELPTLPEAVEQAHGELWRRFVDPHGIVHDFVGELPTPEDCREGRPNAIGWWSPIENGPMFTGLYLPAVCERARRSGLAADRAQARRLAQGLLKCASVSDISGFIARGVGTDGSCHYPLGSDDQTHPWFYGLHAYLKSGIPSEDERRQIIAKVKDVAEALEATGWQCPCDGTFRSQYRGGFQGHLFRDAARYLFLLRALHEITGEPVWLQRYQHAQGERPTGSAKPRGEICAEGYPFDRESIKNIETAQLWIYVGCQASLARLSVMEADENLRANYRNGMAVNAQGAMAGLEAFANFDNNDTKVFGNASWRSVYSTWFPQPTQAEAYRLSQIADIAKRGDRKNYEVRYMRNPLAAAAIVSLNGGEKKRITIERAIRHYDYSKLNMAEFFFAECAFYSLPQSE